MALSYYKAATVLNKGEGHIKAGLCEFRCIGGHARWIQGAAKKIHGGEDGRLQQCWTERKDT